MSLEALPEVRSAVLVLDARDVTLLRVKLPPLSGARLARALALRPRLIILDEPTSALDVLTQANIFNVLKRLKKELGISFILITHDIATASELADDVAVMYAGQVIEFGPLAEVFASPNHPYTKALIAAAPGRLSKISCRSRGYLRLAAAPSAKSPIGNQPLQSSLP